MFTKQLSQQLKNVPKIVKSSIVWQSHRVVPKISKPPIVWQSQNVNKMTGPAFIGKEGHKLEPGPAGSPIVSSGGGGSDVAAITTALNISMPMQVKTGSGRLVTVSLLEAGSISINDAAALSSADQANLIINLTTTSGWVFTLDMPVSNGITISNIDGRAAVSYQ